jgi:hypothetical protein
MNTYEITITDTFAGEPNFSWIRQYETHAKSPLGAIQKLAKHYGAGWRLAESYAPINRYNMHGACITAFVEHIYNPDPDDVGFEKI